MRCCTKNWLLVYLVLLLAASAIQKSTVWKLADEKRCRVFWNLCGELLYDVEDSSILECLKAIHTEHNNSYSYDCEPIIWGYTKHIISDAVVLKLAEEPCRSILGEWNCLVLFAALIMRVQRLYCNLHCVQKC